MSTHATAPELDYSALICEAAVGCNVLNGAVRALKGFETKDKKLQPQLTALHKLTETVLPRMLGNARSRDADFLNTVANTVAHLAALMMRTDGAGMADILAYAETRAQASQPAVQ